MALVLPVRRHHVDQVAVDDRRRVRQVVREGADLLHHVELPEDVGVGLGRELLVGHRAVVLVAVAEALGVEAHHLAAVADVVDLVALDQRRAGDALERPVVDAAGGDLLVGDLPQELAGVLLEGHQHAAIADLLLVAQQLVVGADEDLAAGDGGVAVGLRAEVRDPLHVGLGLDVPLVGQALRRRDHVAGRRAAPHRPVGGAGHRRAVAADGGRGGREDDAAREGESSCCANRSHRLSTPLCCRTTRPTAHRRRGPGCPPCAPACRSSRRATPPARPRRAATPWRGPAPCRPSDSALRA